MGRESVNHRFSRSNAITSLMYQEFEFANAVSPDRTSIAPKRHSLHVQFLKADLDQGCSYRQEELPRVLS